MGVVRSYGDRRALDGFTVSIPAGSVFGLLGPNGSGKTTFVTLLAAMEAPEEGTLRVFGEPPAPRLRARTGTVFQENAQDPLLSAEEYLTLAGRVFGVPGSMLKARIPSLLSSFGLGDRRGDAIASLSGGMRRRLDVARALLHDPDLLILDEPTTGVDPEQRRALWDRLLGSERGRRTIMLATNDLAEADSVCDQVAFLRAGQVVATGTPAELKRGLRKEAVRVTLNGPVDERIERIRSWPGVGAVTLDGTELHVTVDDAATFVPRLFEHAPGAVRAIAIQAATLEDAYFQHIGSRTARTEVAV